MPFGDTPQSPLGGARDVIVRAIDEFQHVWDFRSRAHFSQQRE